jgi:chromosome segregation ATPase
MEQQSFDFSILKKLEEHFVSTQTSIQETNAKIKNEHDKLIALQSKIDELTSQKLSTEMTIGSLQEEKVKSETLYEDARKEYEKVKKCANQLLELFS